EAPALGGNTFAAVGLAVLLCAFYYVTGPRAPAAAGIDPWFERGSAVAARILGGEWWRAVTALTLHANLAHLLANAVACGLFAAALGLLAMLGADKETDMLAHLFGFACGTAAGIACWPLAGHPLFRKGWAQAALAALALAALAGCWLLAGAARFRG